MQIVKSILTTEKPSSSWAFYFLSLNFDHAMLICSHKISNYNHLKSKLLND
jgi:hypothetical protein